MRVNMIDIARINLSVFNGCNHCIGCTSAIIRSLGNMESITRHTKTGYFGINFSTPCFCMLVLFEQEYPGTLTEHRTVALLSKRENPLRRKDMKRLPRLHGPIVDHGL